MTRITKPVIDGLEDCLFDARTQLQGEVGIQFHGRTPAHLKKKAPEWMQASITRRDQRVRRMFRRALHGLPTIPMLPASEGILRDDNRFSSFVRGAIDQAIAEMVLIEQESDNAKANTQ